MKRTAVVLADANDRVGSFEFPAFPRVGDTIHIPGSQDDFGVRIFTVEEVWHYAVGTPKSDFIADDQAALMVTEIG
ncbi:hypothetical protein A9995_11440 [Erythrobacter sp. QSSC1-22B]|uniref:hypothetical protein n=1 Tax=Erythrobacter sp. QSSC1-22B TaxID=1860125 RepID=UPI000805A666|nr:hypothetical protein [Erythrobacter sp. QSSC1-22B]OBX18573.1 hypothetical protein A9995_11440 [Erythrobacter sp. QSSC1-22B]